MTVNVTPAMPVPPIDYQAVRKTICDAVQLSTGLVCIVEKPEDQNAPRPRLPYVSFDFLTPGKKYGPDVRRWSTLKGQWVTEGQRRATAEFNTYAAMKEDAWTWGAALQAALESAPMQEVLRAGGVAVWQVGDLTDLTALLDAGYEGRAHLEVQLGIASMLVPPADTGTIDKVGISGQVVADGHTIDVPEFDVQKP